MSGLHLYELTDQFKSLELLASSDDLPPEVIRDTIEGVEGQWKDKAVAVAAYILDAEAKADSIKAAAKAMQERATRLENRAASLRQYLMFNMLATGTAKVDHDLMTLLLVNNPQTVVIDNPELVPAEFMVQKPPPPPAPDKKLIGQQFKSGVDVPGCHVEQGQRVEIKP